MLESPPAPSAKASDLGFPSPESQGLEPGLLAMGDLDSWVTAVTAVTLPMHDTEVHVLSSPQRNTPPCRETAAEDTAPAFLCLFWAADLGSARSSWLMLCALEPRNPQFQGNFLATGMLAR